MVQANYVIAIIIIVLFVVLSLVAFGIWRLVQIARSSLSISTGSSSSTGSSNEVADG